ncbi:hypothetical protein Tsubulata_037128 [Turnera subulata]|uniref:SWIRM domain-containing protein n=1 Tax=Turnera subulata TaxID=218843 RepID=A0A9Q0FQY4_9ROSI|nr:hypothetical protein Tsubulata_037128 [Turnera subulata]
MEGDDLSDSMPAQAKLGLQKGVPQNSLKPRVRRMGAKERSKKAEMGVDSDDDEPIGALLKLKRARNPKKVKAVEAREEKLVAHKEDDEGFEGMDDTLASFRKKLKGPKKEVGSVSVARPLEDGLLDASVVRGVLNKHREKGRNVKADGKRVRTKGDVAVDDDSVALSSQGDLLEAGKEEGLLPEEGGNLSSDERLGDSFSAFAQKKQPGSVRKSSRGSSLKQDSMAQYLEDELNANAEVVLEVSKPVAGDANAETLSHVVTSFTSFSSPSDPIKEENDQGIDNGVCQASNFENCNDSVRSHDKIHDRYSVNSYKFQATAISQTSVLQNGVMKDEQILDPCVSDVKEESRIYTDCCTASGQNDLLGNQPLKNGLKVEATVLGCDSPNSHNRATNVAPVTQKETDVIADSKQSPKSAKSSEVHSSGFASQMDHHQDTLETYNHLNESTASIKKCSSTLPENKFSDDANKGNYVPSHDCLSNDEEANEKSPPSVTPGGSGSHPEDAAPVPDSEIKDSKLSAAQRAVRKAKRRRLGDMAYEGDADWEVLISEQQFMENDQLGDSDRSFRTRDRSDSSSVSGTEAENGGTAAVSAGLKARAVGPVEKIKFKEILKRKGGLQEYLECRNRILGLWSKDMTRILPLADCGVSDTPAEGESPRASLTRQIYTFLDQSGYINIGIASEKEKAEPSVKHHYKLLEEKKFEGNPEASLADLEDGVSFILGQVKSSEASLKAENAVTTDVGIPVTEATKHSELVAPVTLQLSKVSVREEHPDENIQETSSNSMKVASGPINLGVSNPDPSCATPDSRAVYAITPDSVNEWQSVQSNSCDDTGGTHDLHLVSEERKKIIVIGAGPAGLTAARHLQRQGFSVTILEARERIGGRVFTDFSSLSVPVDLGASIITGVEADLDTERRPDPSSLVCSQLGLELTVLNSDCPLYDIVTGEKVPTDLDEELEAEYNSLLDDMVLVITEKGEHSMKMSLEDGLEYALKSRRMVESGMDIDKSKDSKTRSVDGGDSESNHSVDEILSPLERRVMDWHFAHLEYGCAASLKEVSLPYWNQDDVYGGFGGAHCMIKGGYSNVVESLGEGLLIKLNHVVTDISYGTADKKANQSEGNKVKVFTSNGSEFLGDAVLITVPLGCLKAETIKFSPPLPQWKHSSIQRLGFGVLNKVVLEFPEVFWDDSVDYFGATAEETDRRGHCFMFWNVKKTVGAPVLIALVVGKAAVDGQSMSSDHVSHALMVLRKLFGEASVPDPVASVVTDWGRDPFAYGAYSYVAIGSSGEDYDILGRPVENCLFFAGEATCKEHPDTVGGAMMSGLREAVRIIDILRTGHDVTAEAEAMEVSQKHSDCERDEVRDITKRLEAVELSNVMYKNSIDRSRFLTREALLQDMFFNAKTTAGRLLLAKKLLHLPVESLKAFAGTRKGLTTLNSWILDSMGKDGTQLLRHCVRLLVLVSTDLLAVRLSGIGKTVKEKVCMHTSRDIRAIASQLVSVWLEVFRREKASNRLKLSRQAAAMDALKRKSLNNPNSGKPPLRTHQVSLSTGKSESRSHALQSRPENVEGEKDLAISEEEQAALAAAEAACAAARAAAEAYASSEAKCNTFMQLPKIPSFHKFARREQYTQMDEYDMARKWSGGVLGRQDCISEIDSRNCRVRDWSVDFSAALPNLDSSRMSGDNLSQRSNSNEVACHMNLREQSGESVAVDSSIFTKAWVDSGGNTRIKDHHAIERWQSQAAAADSDFYHSAMHINDEADSNTSSKQQTWNHDGRRNESSVSQVTIHKEAQKGHHRGADRIKHAVVDFVASLLMPVYKARKIDREGYKSIMKKSATKVMEQATDVEKAMAVSQFLDFKRKNKIRAFVDKLIERHMEMKPTPKP